MVSVLKPIGTLSGKPGGGDKYTMSSPSPAMTVSSAAMSEQFSSLKEDLKSTLRKVVNCCLASEGTQLVYPTWDTLTREMRRIYSNGMILLEEKKKSKMSPRVWNEIFSATINVHTPLNDC